LQQCVNAYRPCTFVALLHSSFNSNSDTAAAAVAAPTEPLVVTELTRPEHFSTLFALVEAQSANATNITSSSSAGSGSSSSAGFNSVNVSNMAWDLLMRMPTNAAVLSKLLMVSVASYSLLYTTACSIFL
jgi:hypothetical protein